MALSGAYGKRLILLLHIIIQFIDRINGIGLRVGSECVTFDSISSHPDTSNQPHDIGWIRTMSCTQLTWHSENSISPFTYHRNDYLSLALRAISIKFQPPGGTANPHYTNLTVIAKPYSNPIQYGLNNLKETSYQYDSSGNFIDWGYTSNWIGSTTALTRIPQDSSRCPNPFERDLHEYVYSGCGNRNGIHIFPNRNQTVTYVCTWQWSNPPDQDIEIYFGFALNDSLCDTDTPTLSPTLNPTESTTDPSSSPTIEPSDSPTIEPTVFPTTDPTDTPTTTHSTSSSPSVTPTKSPETNDPTRQPTNEPSSTPSFNPSTNPTVTPTANPTKLLDGGNIIEETLEPTIRPTDSLVVTDQTSDVHMLLDILIIVSVGCICIAAIMLCYQRMKRRKRENEQKKIMFSQSQVTSLEMEPVERVTPNMSFPQHVPYQNEPIDQYRVANAMKYNLPINNLKIVNSNSSTKPMSVSHNVNNIDVQFDDEKHGEDINRGRRTSGFISDPVVSDLDDAMPVGHTAGFIGDGTGTGTGTGTTSNDDNTTGTSEEGTKEISSHPTHSNEDGLEMGTEYTKDGKKEPNTTKKSPEVDTSGYTSV